MVRGFRSAFETGDENELTGAPCRMRYGHELATYSGQQHQLRPVSAPQWSLSERERLVRVEVIQEVQGRELQMLRMHMSRSSSERLKWAVGWVLILMSAGVLRWPEIAINIAATLGGK